MASDKNGAFSRYSALWIALLMQAGATIWWAAGVSRDVEILKNEVARRQGAMALIDGLNKEIVRLEEKLDRVDSILDTRGNLRAKLAQIEEHLRALDGRVVRLENK